MKGLKKAVVSIGAIVLALTGCSNKEAPLEFRTLSPGGLGHFNHAQYIARLYHGGVETMGDKLDIDSDNMNDLYVVCADGTVYHTISRRLLQGEDTASERTWYRGTKESLDKAVEGEYESP